jgi:hypothetical protein
VILEVQKAYHAAMRTYERTSGSGGALRSIASLPGRIAERYQETARERPGEEINFRILTTFLATFTGVRVVTHGIRGDWLPLKNVELGGRKGSHPLHIHHLVWGILMLTGCGYGALLGTDLRWRRRLAPMYGAGVALTFDEFALWLRLEDDYWSSDGRASVDAIIVLGGLLGLAVASPLFWQRAFDEMAKTLPQGQGPARIMNRGSRGA